MIAAGTYAGNWKVTTEPASEPVTTAEAKSHMRVDISDDDTLIDTYIAAARQWVERVGLWRSLITQTITLTLDEFPCDYATIILPQPPAIAITSVTYIATDGTSTVWGASNYRLDATHEPARLTPAYGVSWPSTRDITGAVSIVYTAGYGAASAVPSAIKTAIKFLAANWYENREPTISGTIIGRVPWTVESLLEPYSAKGFA